MPFFLVYGRDPNLPLHQLLEPMQQFLGDPDTRMLNLEAHRLVLAIAKKTLNDNRFKAVHKTMDVLWHNHWSHNCTQQSHQLASVQMLNN